MVAKDGRWTGFRYRPFHCGTHGFRLANARHHNEQVGHLHQAWNGHAERVHGDGFQIGKGLVVDLLHAAAFREFNDADGGGVVETGGWRVVESQMAIFSDTE